MPPGPVSALSRPMPQAASPGGQRFSSRMHLAPSRWLKLHQGPFWCHVIKDRLQGYVHLERVDVALHDVGHQAWALVELHDCVDIRDVIPESGVGRLLHDGEAVQPGPTTDLHPLQIRGQTAW